MVSTFSSKCRRIPWGSDYVYRSPGLKNPGTYDLYSAGPDRIPDTPDDDWGAVGSVRDVRVVV